MSDLLRRRQQRRKERALLDLERAASDLLDAEEDTVTVKRVERDSFENENVQRAGEGPVESSMYSPKRNRSMATALLNCQGEGTIRSSLPR
jgi:glycine cleavage system aminomethyltransferase T